jgi:hypothetical protein
MKKYLWLIFIFIFLFTLASCGTGSSKSHSGSSNYDSDSLVYSSERKVIYSISYFYRNNIEGIKKEKKEVREYVLSVGGYIETANEYNDGKTCDYIYKVPTDKLNNLIDKLDNKDEYSDKTTKTQDITTGYNITQAQIDDLNLRIANLEARLQDESTTYEESLDIGNQIDTLTERLNKLEAKKAMDDNTVNFSTVQIYYRYKDTSNLFVKILLNILIFIGVLLMIVAPFGIIGFVVYIILRKKKNKKQLA